MAEDLIRYDLLVQDALRGVVRKVLTDAAREGLSGEHHFYISFRTEAPGVRMSQRLREKYPQEMTIVLQHQFWDLGVTEHSFEVGLSGFFDPSVQFGLKFDLNDGTEGEEITEVQPATPKIGPRGAASEPTEMKPKGTGLTPIAAGPKIVPALPATREGKETEDGVKAPKPEAAEKGDKEASAEVVSLDAFRKKN